MTDRELLERAAKAAGYDVRWHEAWKCFVHQGPNNTDNPPTLAGQCDVWVPLDDDGALRLAVALRLEVSPDTSEVTIGVPGPDDSRDVTIAYTGDPCAATRRAITIAAAGMEP